MTQAKTPAKKMPAAKSAKTENRAPKKTATQIKAAKITSATTAAADDGQSFAHVERLLKRLETRVPGYPRDLAVLARLAAHIEKKMIEISNASLKPHGLNYAMYQVLVISHGSETATPKELADATGERPTNVTHICDELEKRGLVLRNPHASDRRSLQIVLTESGRALLALLQPQMWDIWRTRYQGIDAADRKRLLESMRRQFKNLGGV